MEPSGVQHKMNHSLHSRFTEDPTGTERGREEVLRARMLKLLHCSSRFAYPRIRFFNFFVSFLRQGLYCVALAALELNR